MRIAFVEWFPRICGTGDGTVHLSAAAEALGHTMERVTFSKSGKDLAAFGGKGPDWKTVKLKDGPAYLDEFDLIIPSDIVCQHPNVDGQAIKHGGMPYYIDLMYQTSTPFALLIWGGYYHSKHNPFMQELLHHPNFTGAAWSPRVPDAAPRMKELEHPDNPIRWVDIPYHPYDVGKYERYIGPRKSEILMTSRVTSPKGQDVALGIFEQLRCNINIWGTSAYGMPSPAWRLWELGVALGLREKKFPVIAKRSKNRHPMAHKFYTGKFIFQHPTSRHVYRYHDHYDSLDEIDWKPWVGLSLTNDVLHGSLEYACLDIIAKGSVLLPPAHMMEFCEYDSIVGLPFNNASFNENGKGGVREGRNKWDRDTCVEMIQHAVGKSDIAQKRLANRQYKELIAKHDPALILKPLIKEAGR
jgi:hypothetical protein